MFIFLASCLASSILVVLLVTMSASEGLSWRKKNELLTSIYLQELYITTPWKYEKKSEVIPYEPCLVAVKLKKKKRMGHCWTSPSTSISSTLQSALLQYFNWMSRPYICQKFKTQAPSTPLCTGISFLPGVLLHWSCVVYFVQHCTCIHVP